MASPVKRCLDHLIKHYELCLNPLLIYKLNASISCYLGILIQLMQRSIEVKISYKKAFTFIITNCLTYNNWLTNLSYLLYSNFILRLSQKYQYMRELQRRFPGVWKFLDCEHGKPSDYVRVKPSNFSVTYSPWSWTESSNQYW